MNGARRRVSSWARFLYWYTIVGAGGCGLLIVLLPSAFAAAFGLPGQDPYILGMMGSVFLAFSAVAAWGLRCAARFAPIFLVQFGYKSIWLIAVLVPRLVAGPPAPFYAWVMAGIFATYVALDVLVIRSQGLLRGEPGE